MCWNCVGLNFRLMLLTTKSTRIVCSDYVSYSDYLFVYNSYKGY